MRKPLKILMVEDDPVDAELVLHVLKNENLVEELRLVVDKENYLLSLDEFKPDLVLSDNSLPQFNGTEALELLRRQSLHIPFILITGTVSEEFAAGMIRLGADDYILKDSLVRLPGSIKTAMKHRRVEREKMEATAKLVESEEKYRTLVERVTDAFIALDPNWCYTYMNSQAGRLVHRNPVEMIGKNVWEEFPEAVGSATYKAMTEAMLDQRFVTTIDYYEPLNLWQQNYIYPSPEGISMFIRDISMEKRAEIAVQQMKQQIFDQKIQDQKKTTRAVIHAQEKERNHIGQELHDNVNQLLVGAKMYLSIAGKNEVVKEAVKYPIELIENSIKEIRSLASRQVTPVKNVNLKDMVQSLIEQVSESTALKTSFAYDISSETIADELKLNTYRIIQEQLNNIVKHAGASNINLFISENDGMLNILIEDDGKGFDVNKKRKGIGLSNITNRIESFNGQLHIESTLDHGSRMQVAIPLSEPGS